MTIRQIIHEIDRELGRAEEVIAAATAFADRCMPGIQSILDREVPDADIEKVKEELRAIRAAQEPLAKKIVARINAAKN